MRSFIVAFFTLSLLVLTIQADLTEKNMVKVTITKFGSFNSQTTSYYQNLVKAEDSQSDFKGSGFWGKLAGKMFAKGHTGTITNLNEKNVYSIAYDDKSYTVSTIEKFFQDKNQFKGDDQESDDEEQSESEKDERYTVIRQEFKVIDTGLSKKINRFDAHQYNLIYICELKDNVRGGTKTDSMFVDLYTTTDQAVIDKAAAERKTFAVEYAKAVGIDMETDDYDQLLGKNWLSMISALDPQSGRNEVKVDYSEFKKIKGYPVLTDGHFYSKSVNPQQSQVSDDSQSQEESSSIPTSLGGMFGKMKKKHDDKKAAEKPKAGEYSEILSYYTEIVELSFNSVPADALSVPSGFKKK
ncbi:MAG: hypothetical protein KBA26_02285 [Candidatus Delongbacteria bacterium]|nr:hypothetical protein [Candidatus Delongbacteria bacterium]